jgi:hypothetical protein
MNCKYLITIRITGLVDQAVSAETTQLYCWNVKEALDNR